MASIAISGPLLDRIAIHVTVRPVDVEAWSSSDAAQRMTSATMREMVVRARDIQTQRFAETNGVDCNARIPEGMFATHCAMEPAAEALFLRAQKSLLVSARARGHIVRVARTIADLEGMEKIAERHVAEAFGYRGRSLTNACLAALILIGRGSRDTIWRPRADGVAGSHDEHRQLDCGRVAVQVLIGE